MHDKNGELQYLTKFACKEAWYCAVQLFDCVSSVLVALLQYSARLSAGQGDAQTSSAPGKPPLSPFDQFVLN